MQREKIPKSAVLTGRFIPGPTPAKGFEGVTVEIYTAEKSHGYQSDYQAIPVSLVAVKKIHYFMGVPETSLTGNRSVYATWKVHELRGKDRAVRVAKVISECEKGGLVMERA